MKIFEFLSPWTVNNDRDLWNHILFSLSSKSLTSLINSHTRKFPLNTSASFSACWSCFLFNSKSLRTFPKQLKLHFCKAFPHLSILWTTRTPGSEWSMLVQTVSTVSEQPLSSCNWSWLNKFNSSLISQGSAVTLVGISTALEKPETQIPLWSLTSTKSPALTKLELPKEEPLIFNLTQLSARLRHSTCTVVLILFFFFFGLSHAKWKKSTTHLKDNRRTRSRVFEHIYFYVTTRPIFPKRRPSSKENDRNEELN